MTTKARRILRFSELLPKVKVSVQRGIKNGKLPTKEVNYQKAEFQAVEYNYQGVDCLIIMDFGIIRFE